MKKLWIWVGLSLAIISCGDDNSLCNENLNETNPIELEFIPIHKKILDLKSAEELNNFINQEPLIAHYFLKKDNYPNDSIMANVLLQRFTNPHIDTLKQEIDRVFGDLSLIKQDLNKAFSRFAYYYPNVRLPKVKTVATGLENGADLYVSDSLIVIGLDFYLGNGAKYRPLGFPEYILQKYSKEYIVPSIMLLYGISPNYNKSSQQDKTMLADMISYGKAYYFAKTMMPCNPDSTLIGYTQKEINESAQNAPIIWAHFLDNELLYTQDNFLKKKYLSERPKTYEIGNECPGRIGAWLGWAIVSQYARRKQVSLKELMDDTDAQHIFQESKYRPVK